MKDKDRELRLILEKYYLPAISLDLAQGEIKALYKPLEKEELEKIMWEVARIEIGSPASIMLAQAIINARGEK